MSDYIAFNTMPTTVKSVSVSDNVCNQESLKEWTLEFWSNVESLEIGSYCFKYCKRLTLKSLFKLKTWATLHRLISALVLLSDHLSYVTRLP